MSKTRALTPEEIKVVSQSFSGPYAKRDKALFMVGVKTGFRIAELLSLRLADVWQHGRVVEAVAVRKSQMKGKLRGRTVKLHPCAQQALLPWIEQLLDMGATAETYLFLSRKGLYCNAPISSVQAWRVLHAACEANELQGAIGTHGMRKTFAQKVYANSGSDLLITQKALGHTSVASTQFYLDVNQNDVDKAILGD